jgi:serine/threonine-protein kinase
MGEVWRARDTRLQREVALKILPEAFASDAERLSRFTREAHVLASLNHPGIGAIYSFEEVDGTHFLVLELVAGETLKERVAHGPIPAAEALGIARQIAEALGAAHGKGILHRDLKPANVKVTPEGRVKLLDFGLAKAFAGRSASTEISQSPTAAADGTRQGLILGTVSYMSPEQARGRVLDARSDLWSFGCLLYEMLAGRKAFGGDTLSDILVAILDRDPDWEALPAATPPSVRDLLHSLLEKDVERRVRDVGDVKAALDGAFASHSTVQTLLRVPSTRRPLRWLVAGGAVAAALAVAFLLRTRAGDGALPKEKYLAIMPFKDLSGRPDGQLLVDGLTESVAARLTKVQKIMVMTAGGPAAPDPELARYARDRGANLLLQGAYRSQGDRVRLTYSLLATSSFAILAGDEVEGSASDQFAVEDRLVESVLASLRVHVESAPAAGAVAANRPSEGEPYYKALGLLRRYDDPRSLLQAVDLLRGIAGGERSALVQSALGRAWVERYRSTKDPAAAEAAHAAAERAIALDDRSPEAHLAFGQLLTAMNKPKDAVVEIRRAIERQAPSADTTIALADALVKAGENAQAEAAYRDAIAMNPEYWSGYNKLGALYYQRGDLKKALESFRFAADKNPTSARAQSNMGAVLLRLGNLPEAEVAFRRAVALPPPDANAWSNLGTCKYLLGQSGEAAAAFEKAVDLAPYELRYRVNLGDAYTFAPGLADKAKTSYEKALELAETERKVHALEAGTLSYVAKAEARTGRTAQALATVNEAVALDPNDRNVLFRAAIVQNALGKKTEALHLLQRAVEKGLGTTQIAREPEFADLKDNASFQKLIAPPPEKQ